MTSVQRDHLAAAPLFRARLFPLVHEKVIEGREEKGAEFSFLPSDRFQWVLLQQAREKFLREILCVVRGVTPLPDIGIEGIPVGLTQLRQRVASVCGITGSSSED